MTVKRYDAHTNIDDFKADWHEKKDGPMVRYDDYAALLKERDEARTALSSAMLTISQITDVVGTNDTLSISQQVAELAAGKDTFLQIALSEVAEHFDMLPNAGTREWDAVKLSCMNKLREIF